MNRTEQRARPIRTLVVDDAPAAARAIRNFLESEAATEVVGIAQCGIEAIEMAKFLRPDLMLLDLFMPGMSGLEVVKGVRSASPKTRIIIITVLGEDMSTECRGFGAEGFVVKNRLEEQLPREIEKVFGARA